MPAAPSNYIDVTSFPFSQTVTQADFNAGTYGSGTNNVWFRIINATPQYLGTCTNKGGTFTPRSRMYRDNSGAMTLVRGVSNANAYFADAVADTYWIEIYNLTPSFGDPSDFNFTTLVDVAARNPTVPDEAVIINDDQSGFPAAVMTMDGEFLGYQTNVPGGETGASLADGTMLIHDRFGDVGPAGSLALLDSDGALIASITGVSTTTIPTIMNSSSAFYVSTRLSDPTPIYRISATGTVTGPVANITTTSGTMEAGAVSRDGSILYWTQGEFSHAIHRHDLVSDVPLSGLYSVSEISTPGDGEIGRTSINQHPGDILVLSDDSIVTWYRVYSPPKDVLIHVSAAGTLLHSYTYAVGDGKQIDHLSYAPDDPVGIRIWFFLSEPGTLDDTRGRYAHLTLSTGVEDSPFEVDLYSAGVSKVQGCASLFGPSASCTFVTKVYGTVTPEEPDESPEPPPIDSSTPCPCPGTPGGPGPIDAIPNPIGPTPPWVAMCEGGCGVDSVADIAVGEVWL